MLCHPSCYTIVGILKQVYFYAIYAKSSYWCIRFLKLYIRLIHIAFDYNLQWVGSISIFCQEVQEILLH